ncbi:GNAT family N-acetyltransferase [Paenibacillus sp.]|uniref:GNAT family N-acetyltransferase n=1 Tax=Paenibacillus sp. TaxID=58172 RepID=UPI002D689987|nr:GNAT family N-acetyltransferase [Paenibacillus sp.]HZG88441.1 GNAT family N-acetyltransferase [Paenibacillus sp.]
MMKLNEQVLRIEALELELTKLNASRSLTTVERQLEVWNVGDCTLLRDKTDPQSMYYNRVKGFGPKSLSMLDELIRQFGGQWPSIDLLPGRLTESVAQALILRGFIPVDQLVFMAVETAAQVDPMIPGGVRIDTVTRENAEEWIEWIGRSTGRPVTDKHVIDRAAPYFYRSDFVNYMLTIDGQPAAMGSLFIRDQEGYIANDYTFESFRGRGLQLALLRHRLKEANARGVERVYTDVEFGSVSHNNMARAGFQTVFLNTFWIKANERRD